MKSPTSKPKSLTEQFRKHWQISTDDDNLTLHGFQRFKTTHLLNLRFLEEEIAEMDRTIYQAGLNLSLSPSSKDRLGLKHAKRDSDVPKIDETITKDFVLHLRDLIRQYDEALVLFNNIMAMETFSLLDDEKRCGQRDDLTVHEMYKTRLIRTDVGPRSQQDPLQRQIHKFLRSFRYRRLLKRSRNDSENIKFSTTGRGWSHFNTLLVAQFACRFIIAVTVGSLLVIPLAILSHQSRLEIQLITVSIFIILLSAVVAILLKASNVEIMVVSAAYAAVLSVFVSNGAASAV